MQRKKASILLLILLASVGISRVLASPNAQAIHNVDLLQLVASGLCLGVALSLILRKSSA